MSALRIGATISADQATALKIPGSWSVWSQAGDCPGGYFLAPSDDAARNSGLKYVVIKATVTRESVIPVLELVRTDPYRPEYLPTKKNGARR